MDARLSSRLAVVPSEDSSEMELDDIDAGAPAAAGGSLRRGRSAITSPSHASSATQGSGGGSSGSGGGSGSSGTTGSQSRGSSSLAQQITLQERRSQQQTMTKVVQAQTRQAQKLLANRREMAMHRYHDVWGSDKTLSMVEQFLDLLVELTFDRLGGGTPAALLATHYDPMAALRQQLVHKLLLKPSTYSDLKSAVEDDLRDLPQFDQVLSEVAVLRPAAGVTHVQKSATYDIRDSALSEFSPYYVGYAPEERAAAESKFVQRRKERRSKSSSTSDAGTDAGAGSTVVRSHLSLQLTRDEEDTVYPPLPRLPSFSAAALPLAALVCAPAMGQIWWTILGHALRSCESQALVWSCLNCL